MKLTSTNSIHLTWDGVTGAVGYDIIYRTNLDSKSTQRTLTTGCTITAYDDSIRFNSDITAVYYSVRAYKYTKDSNNNTTRKDSDYCAAVVIYSN
ncbi:MAG: hypothetical protein FWD78_08740 [Treponema sp.]|nr:hypothetical protein [Treponema sp.]